MALIIMMMIIGSLLGCIFGQLMWIGKRLTDIYEELQYQTSIKQTGAQR